MRQVALPAAALPELVAVFRRYPDLEQVILFGSRATAERPNVRTSTWLRHPGPASAGRLALDLDDLAECGVRRTSRSTMPR